MKFEPGDVITAVLHSPREKLLGILHAIEPAGITVRSIELGYFDDWCRSIAEGDIVLTMNDNFFPMWRVERISKDSAAEDLPSMAELFESRTGLRLADQ